jgi:hypothetical protein
VNRIFNYLERSLRWLITEIFSGITERLDCPEGPRDKWKQWERKRAETTAVAAVAASAEVDVHQNAEMAAAPSPELVLLANKRIV